MSKQDVCQISCVHEEKVSRIKEKLFTHNTLDVAKIFKALADDTRIKIAYILALEEELCVCDIAAIIDASTATTSHHLRLLRKMGLTKYRKEGKLVYYSLDDDHVKNLIKIAFEHQQEMSNRLTEEVVKS
ncbi:ArsR/SmtB family transcription factor [Jeotgalibacillus terrae]|uniref:ArsR/SmtB family transcription factor n=1 Tax=Jeotgalibacillus terrae TaxID=587735 RepID=A0ABW5ZKR4_9BACL|nr:metalloregulator ArsR/SmtB family transcription factor [Jeotgalibacillus terrae]MBM7578513.1 DNA-binding transcriptional ArsR family regulator [Jeotgalibacillus terrae]